LGGRCPFATAGYLPEEMGLGPVYAIPKSLKIAGLKLQDIDVIELNEAFGRRRFPSSKKAGLDISKLSHAVQCAGNPLGCTGAKLTATIIRELKRRNGRYGIVTMCMAAAWARRGFLRTWINHKDTKEHEGRHVASRSREIHTPMK